MELAYMPDNISFIHGIPMHRPQETWSDVNSVHSHVKNLRNRPDAKVDERNCHICRDKKKKILSGYMMKKARGDKEKMAHIQEEEEEESKKGH